MVARARTSVADTPPTTIWVPPILRWAGSKRKLLPLLIRNSPKNYDRYIEPFCGSACLFFALQPNRAILSDINLELINLYKVLKKRPELLSETTSSIPVDKDTYQTLRSQNPAELNQFDRAVRFFYLNRYCFNGVYRTNKSGGFNVPMGKKFGAFPEPEHFLLCQNALKVAKLQQTDFSEVMREAGEGDFVYVDPPYSSVLKRNRGEYGENSFTYLDLARLVSSLKDADQRGAKILLSYAADAEITNLLPKKWKIGEVQVNRHVGGFKSQRSSVKEILVTNSREGVIAL